MTTRPAATPDTSGRSSRSPRAAAVSMSSALTRAPVFCAGSEHATSVKCRARRSCSHTVIRRVPSSVFASCATSSSPEPRLATDLTPRENTSDSSRMRRWNVPSRASRDHSSTMPNSIAARAAASKALSSGTCGVDTSRTVGHLASRSGNQRAPFRRNVAPARGPSRAGRSGVQAADLRQRFGLAAGDPGQVERRRIPVPRRAM